jgi:hypothetical protein
MKEMTIIEKIIKRITDFFRFLFHGPDDDRFGRPDNRSRVGTTQFLRSYKDFITTSFETAPRNQQDKWVHRFCQITCIGFVCVILNSFYSAMMPIVRIVSLPLLVAIAWYAANLIASDINKKR